MVRASALIILAMASSLHAQTIAEKTRLRNGRDVVYAAASDDRLKYSKIVIATTDAGSRWMARAADLVEAWDKGGKYPHIWLFIDHSKDKTHKARETRMRAAVRCDEQMFAILSMTDYAANGTVIYSSTTPDFPSAYTAIIPETMAEAVQRELCPLA